VARHIFFQTLLIHLFLSWNFKSNVANAQVTWSQSEYAHPGMQWMYLTLKSWQRFTETWALLERATRLGLFEPHRPVTRVDPMRRSIKFGFFCLKKEFFAYQ